MGLRSRKGHARDYTEGTSAAKLRIGVAGGKSCFFCLNRVNCSFFDTFLLPKAVKYVYWLARPLPDRIMLPDNIIPFESPKAEHRYPSLPMKSELVYKAAEIIDDPQVLINLVSKRVRQLNSGRAPLIPTVPSMGAADIALTEIIEGKIKLLEVVPEQV